MGIGLTSPDYLWGLLVIPLVLWLMRHSSVGLSPTRRRAIAACRLLEVLCLVLALSGFRLERVGDEVCVLFAVDASRSVPEERRNEALKKINEATGAMSADDRAGLITFAGQPLVEALPQPRFKAAQLQSVPDSDFTDIASLIRLSSGIFPEGTRHRLVMFSDGNENRGNALEAVRGAIAAGVSIDVFPIDAPPRNEVSLARLDMPSRAEKDEPFEWKVDALATGAGPATLRFFRDGQPLGKQEVSLQPGNNTFSTTYVEESPGFHRYEAAIESAMDVQPANNSAGAFTQVSGPSRVLIVGTEEDNRALDNALAASNLVHESAADLPPSLSGLQAYDAVYLNNVPAEKFQTEQLENIERYVRDLGGGLGMIGGENSFAPGGWIGTAVERSLPVNMEIKAKEQFPSMAMVMVIDKSGSMGGIGSGAVSKMDMANRAASDAVKLLGPRDMVGVVAFDGEAKWAVQLQEAKNREQISSTIRSIAPGGGTDAYKGALLAYEALVKAKARIKHVILLTDGQTSPADFPELLDRMKGAGITLSSIAIGSDADEAFMQDIARRGGGRFYSCPDPSRVPRIFVRETVLVQRSYMIEETATPVLTASHSIMEDASLQAMPPLHGRVVTEMKSRAEQVLKLKDNPLLAVWEYGLGHSAAYTSDAIARWSSDWAAWPGFATFWDRLIRWSLRSVSSVDLHPQISFDRGKGKILIEAATPDGERLNFLNLKARLTSPDLTMQEIPLRQTAIGRYEAEFDADRPGAYLAGITDDQGRQATAGGMVAFSPEFKDFKSNDYLLSEIARQTGGKVNPTAQEIFRREGEVNRTGREMTLPLLSAVVFLLLLEVALRRLGLDEEWLARVRAAWSRLMPRLLPAGMPADALDEGGVTGSLKTRTRSVRSTLKRGETEAVRQGDVEPISGPVVSPKPQPEILGHGKSGAGESKAKNEESVGHDEMMARLRSRKEKAVIPPRVDLPPASQASGPAATPPAATTAPSSIGTSSNAPPGEASDGSRTVSDLLSRKRNRQSKDKSD